MLSEITIINSGVEKLGIIVVVVVVGGGGGGEGGGFLLLLSHAEHMHDNEVTKYWYRALCCIEPSEIGSP